MQRTVFCLILFKSKVVGLKEIIVLSSSVISVSGPVSCIPAEFASVKNDFRNTSTVEKVDTFTVSSKRIVKVSFVRSNRIYSTSIGRVSSGMYRSTSCELFASLSLTRFPFIS